MYMFVLVTLIVALIGIYAQVFNMQTAHMTGQQTGIAQTMMDWHATATGLAQNAVAAASVTDVAAGGCSLTQGFNLSIAGAPPNCTNTGGQNVYISQTGDTQPATLRVCSSDPINGTPPCRPTLPQGYINMPNPLAFYSMAYTAAGQNYILTFVPAPAVPTNGMPAFLCLPGAIPNAPNCGQTIDVSMNDLMAQIKHRGVLMFGYGTVGTCNASPPTAACPTGKQLVTPPVPDSSVPPVMKTLAYPVPTIVPTGAFGIISQINLCTSC